MTCAIYDTLSNLDEAFRETNNGAITKTLLIEYCAKCNLHPREDHSCETPLIVINSLQTVFCLFFWICQLVLTQLTMNCY